MKLPLELELAVTGLLAYLITEGLKSLGRYFNIDVSGYKAALVSVFSGLLIATVNGALALLPIEYHQIAEIVMVVLVAVFAPAGVYSTFKKFAPASDKKPTAAPKGDK
jgi:uncharacterized membrane protein